jgi:hypothetical protein
VLDIDGRHDITVSLQLAVRNDEQFPPMVYERLDPLNVTSLFSSILRFLVHLYNYFCN